MAVYTQVNYFLQRTGVNQGAGEDEGIWDDRAQLSKAGAGVGW